MEDKNNFTTIVQYIINPILIFITICYIIFNLFIKNNYNKNIQTYKEYINVSNNITDDTLNSESNKMLNINFMYNKIFEQIVLNYKIKIQKIFIDNYIE